MQHRDIRRYRQRLLEWFDDHARDLPWRHTREPYAVWVSEVMLQQTQVATVIPYYLRFIERFPDVHALAEADRQDVLKSWEKMGYYARVRNLHDAAKQVRDMGGEIPSDYDTFRDLPGVGDYIAAAVLSIAFGEPHAAVDGNVRRVLARVHGIEEPVNVPSSGKVFAEAARALLDRDRPGDHNQAMMELGAVVCRPKQPRCTECPVSFCCVALRDGHQHTLPVRRPRRKVPHHHIAVGVVRRGCTVLITRRPEDGLLGGLWEFPGGKVRPDEHPEDACRREIREEVNIEIDDVRHLTRVDHAYTHFTVAIDVYACAYGAGEIQLSGPSDYRWVRVDELDDYPFPGANHKFLPLVRETLTP